MAYSIVHKILITELVLLKQFIEEIKVIMMCTKVRLKQIWREVLNDHSEIISVFISGDVMRTGIVTSQLLTMNN